MNDWTMAINDKKTTDVMYIDMSKAFDMVSHVKLIYKLKNIGIGGALITWISGAICLIGLNYLDQQLFVW